MLYNGLEYFSNPHLPRCLWMNERVCCRKKEAPELGISILNHLPFLLLESSKGYTYMLSFLEEPY